MFLFLFARFAQRCSDPCHAMQILRARTGSPRQNAIGTEQTFYELSVTMTPAHRVVLAIVTLQQYGLQRAYKSDDWGLGLMPSLARSL